MNRPLQPISIALLCVWLAACAPDSPISTDGAWIRLPPPDSNAAAAYMTINNHAVIELSITEVRSDRFARVEMHKTQIEDGVMQMRAVDSIDIPPGGSATLAPGGLHFMLMQPVEALSETSRVPLAFYSDDELVLEMTVAVSRQAP